MNPREQLEQAIAIQESLRSTLGDAVVDTTIDALRKQLATLDTPPPVSEQRKQVTILFADVSGFTAMSETLDAEDVHQLMNALWQEIDEIIVQRGGKIDKHIGDAVMALWGVDASREDDPEQAIRAALEMQAALTARGNALNGDNAPATTAHRPVLGMRIGINTGPVLLGEIGTTGEFTAMGDTINIASRLEHAAPVGGIFISHDTFSHVRGLFIIEDLPPLTVKGKSEPLRVYAVKSARTRAFRMGTRGIEGLETRMVGRAAELEKMRTMLRAMLDRRDLHLLTVTGEAGLGKSRLLHEFDLWIDFIPEEVRYFKGRADEQWQRLPYSLARDWFSFRFHIADSDPAAVARQKLEDGFRFFMGEDGVEKSHFIGHLLGFDFSDSPHIRGIIEDARQIHDRAFHYTAQFFRAAARQRPAVILLDDIHWADDGSLDLLDYLARNNDRLPILMVALTRPSLFARRPSWGESAKRHTRLDLRPLSSLQSRHLVEEILRLVPDIPQVLQDTIIGNADGNPFYVEEIIKVMIEDGVIVKSKEAWQIVPERLAALRIPPTLTGILQSRLDRLLVPEREILQRASVVGRIFWDTAVSYLHLNGATHPAGVEAEALRTLCARELIYPRSDTAFAGAQEYIFKHAMLHDVAYESVLKRSRRVYHRQTAEWLAASGGVRSNEYAGLIAAHYEQAGDDAQTAEWYGRAARQAQKAYAHNDAIAYYKKALDLGGSQLSGRFDLLHDLSLLYRSQAMYGEEIEICRLMLTEAEQEGDSMKQALAYSGLSYSLEERGDHQEALKSADHAIQLLESVHDPDPAYMTEALYRKGWTLYRLGQFEEALALSVKALETSEDANNLQRAATGLNLMGTVYDAMGQYESSTDCKKRALAIERDLGNRMRETVLLNNLGETDRLRGDYRQAVARYQEMLTISQEIGYQAARIFCLTNLGGAQVGLGDYETAVKSLQSVLDEAPENWVGLSEVNRFLAHAYLQLNDTDTALEAAQRALALARTFDSPDMQGHAWRVLGLTAVALQQPVAANTEESARFDAETCFQQAATIFKEAGMERELALTWRDWARYKLTSGSKTEGEAMRRRAQDAFIELNLPLLARETEAAKLLG